MLLLFAVVVVAVVVLQLAVVITALFFCPYAVQVREHLAWHERHLGYLEEKRRLAKEWRLGRRQLEHEEAVSESRVLPYPERRNYKL